MVIKCKRFRNDEQLFDTTSGENEAIFNVNETILRIRLFSFPPILKRICKDGRNNFRNRFLGNLKSQEIIQIPRINIKEKLTVLKFQMKYYFSLSCISRVKETIGANILFIEVGN